MRSVDAGAMARRRRPCAGAGARGPGNRGRGSRARPGDRGLVPGRRRRAGARASRTGGARPSQLRMRAPARLPARIGTTPRQGWPGSRWRRAIPGCDAGVWSRCWRSARRPATTTTPLEGVEFPRLVEWTCHRVLASRWSATLAPPSGWPARTRRFRRRRRRSPTPRYARAFFATSRFTARSWRRGKAGQSGQGQAFEPPLRDSGTDRFGSGVRPRDGRAWRSASSRRAWRRAARLRHGRSAHSPRRRCGWRSRATAWPPAG